MTPTILETKLPPRVKNLIGNQYGRLTVIGYAGKTKCGPSAWRCICSCGAVRDVAVHNLKSGNTVSCGCYGIEARKKSNTTRGGLTPTRIGAIWRAMMRRCYNDKSPSFIHYGGRGIKVCDRWHSLELFAKDIGDIPKGLTLDRINNDGDYCPENIRYATVKDQVRNRRMTLMWNGVPIAQIADEQGISYETLYYRLKKHGTPFPEHLEKKHG